MEYNPPNTRERIEARRRARRGGKAPRRVRRGPGFALSWKSLRDNVRQRMPRPALAVVREQAPRQARPDGGSQVKPGARLTLGGWVRSGRLVSLLLFLASIGSLAYLFVSPQFTIRQVRVSGNNALRNEQVVELAGITSAPVWFVDAEQVAGRLLQSAYIEKASVAVALPDQATIVIAERRPEVRWQTGGVQYLVDSSGKVLDAASTPPEPDTLVIADTSTRQLAPNDQLDPDALKLARALVLRLPGELAFTPAQIGWDYGVGVYVRSDKGQTIIFGQSEQLDRKLSVLNVLLKDQTKFSYLDLRPINPFYRE